MACGRHVDYGVEKEAQESIPLSRALGDGVTVAQQILVLLVLVRIQIPQIFVWRFAGCCAGMIELTFQTR